MLRCRLVFFILVIASAVVWGRIRKNEIKLKIFPNAEEDSAFENEMRGSLETAKNVLADKTAQAFIEFTVIATSKLMGPASFAFDMLKATLTAGAYEIDSRDSLIKSIASGTQREIVRDKIKDINAELQTFESFFHVLKVGSSTSNVSIVHSMHQSLDTIVNKFASETSLFRKYPQLVVKPLLEIASMFINLYPIERSVDTNFTISMPTSCTLGTALEEYRNYFTYERLKQIYLDHQNFVATAFEAPILFAPYNRLGYAINDPKGSTIQEGIIRCSRDIRHHARVKDGADGTEYDDSPEFEPSHVGNGFWNSFSHHFDRFAPFTCYGDYLCLVRHRVEEFFEDAIDMTGRICQNDKLNHPHPRQCASGSGWLIMKIGKFTTGQRWDHPDVINLNPNDVCDPYIIVYIDGNAAYTTQTLYNSGHHTEFDETYMSSKIRKTSSIQFKVFDKDDAVLTGNDDLMLDTSTTIDYLLRVGCINKGEEMICVKTFWKDEFVSC